MSQIQSEFLSQGLRTNCSALTRTIKTSAIFLLLHFRCKMMVRNVALLRSLFEGAPSQLNIEVYVSALENRKERTTTVIMATMAIVLGNGILEQKTSEGLREAGLAVSLAQNARLIQLSRRLSKTIKILREFFNGIDQRAQAAKTAPPHTA